MEYTIVINLSDDKQIVSSGFRRFADAREHIADRVRGYDKKTIYLSRPRSIVVIGGDGGVAWFDGDTGHSRDPGSARQVQNWYAAERAAVSETSMLEVRV